MCEDPNRTAEILTVKINSVLDKFAPGKVFQTRSKFAPWISDELNSVLYNSAEEGNEGEGREAEVGCVQPDFLGLGRVSGGEKQSEPESEGGEGGVTEEEAGRV